MSGSAYYVSICFCMNSEHLDGTKVMDLEVWEKMAVSSGSKEVSSVKAHQHNNALSLCVRSSKGHSLLCG